MANDKREQARNLAVAIAKELDNSGKLHSDGDWASVSHIVHSVIKDAGHAAATAEGIPQSDAIDVLLWCPQCFEQHVDDAMPDVCEKCGLSLAAHPAVGSAPPSACFVFTAWLNPPHKSHRCNFCNHVWRPADVPTNGVLKLETQGKADGSAKPSLFASRKDFDDAVEIASGQAQSDGWVAIETVDDLPKVNQPYLFTCPSRQGPFVKEVWFSKYERDMCIQFAGRFLAYQELPAPYQRPSREGE